MKAAENCGLHGIKTFGGAFVVPGARFEFENHFRLGCAPREEVLRAGLAAVSDFLKELARAQALRGPAGRRGKFYDIITVW